jgi:hypothetical protein
MKPQTVLSRKKHEKTPTVHSCWYARKSLQQQKRNKLHFSKIKVQNWRKPAKHTHTNKSVEARFFLRSASSNFLTNLTCKILIHFLWPSNLNWNRSNGDRWRTQNGWSVSGNRFMRWLKWQRLQTTGRRRPRGLTRKKHIRDRTRYTLIV